MPRCIVCSRQARGFSHTGNGKTVDACSLRHLAVAMEQIGWSAAEADAEKNAGREGGRYLDEQCDGRTDLADLSEEQWHAFVHKIISVYCTTLDEHSKEVIPFDGGR